MLLCAANSWKGHRKGSGCYISIAMQPCYMDLTEEESSDIAHAPLMHLLHAQAKSMSVTALLA